MADKKRTITVNGLRAYVSQPEQQMQAGVLVLPTIVGIEEHMEAVCGWINDAGLAALAWDPFSAYDANMPLEQRAPIGRHELEDAAGRDEQITWVDYMHEELGLEHVGVVGFCLGGRMALSLCAADPRVQGCGAYHPSIESPPPAKHLDAVAAAREIGCPVQVLYPGRDHITHRPTFEALREALDSRSAPSIIHLYPEAEHGFTEGFSVVSKVDRSANPANVAAKRLGWAQTSAFFQACLS